MLHVSVANTWAGMTICDGHTLLLIFLVLQGGSSALYWVSGNGDISMVKTLLERGANVDVLRNVSSYCT